MKLFPSLLILLAATLPFTVQAAHTSTDGAAELAVDLHTEPSATAVTGGIRLENPTTETVGTSIFSITGTLVTSMPVGPVSDERVDLRPGIYVVRIADNAVRILVR